MKTSDLIKGAARVYLIGMGVGIVFTGLLARDLAGVLTYLGLMLAAVLVARLFAGRLSVTRERRAQIDAEAASWLAPLAHGAGGATERELRRTLRDRGALLIGAPWRTIVRRLGPARAARLGHHVRRGGGGDRG